MPPALDTVHRAVECGRVIVFFDGHCNLCDRLVRALLRADTRGVLLFAPLTGQTAKELNIDSGQPTGLTALCVLTADGVFYGADAVIHLCHHLPQPLASFKHLTLLPAFLRNNIYRAVADNRYLLFGKRPVCARPSLAETPRFLL